MQVGGGAALGGDVPVDVVRCFLADTQHRGQACGLDIVVEGPQRQVHLRVWHAKENSSWPCGML